MLNSMKIRFSSERFQFSTKAAGSDGGEQEKGRWDYLFGECESLEERRRYVGMHPPLRGLSWRVSSHPNLVTGRSARGLSNRTSNVTRTRETEDAASNLSTACCWVGVRSACHHWRERARTHSHTNSHTITNNKLNCSSSWFVVGVARRALSARPVRYLTNAQRPHAMGGGPSAPPIPTSCPPRALDDAITRDHRPTANGLFRARHEPFLGHRPSNPVARPPELDIWRWISLWGDFLRGRQKCQLDRTGLPTFQFL